MGRWHGIVSPLPPPCVWVQGVSGPGVPFQGKPVSTLGTRVWWRVALWDGTGRPCGLCEEVGFWEAGPVETGDWHGAHWLTQYPAGTQNYSGCGFYEDHALPLFRTAFVADPSTLASATLHTAGLGYHRAYINGVPVSDHALDTPWTNYDAAVMFTTEDVTALVTGGPQHVLGVEVGNGWWNPSPMTMFGRFDFRDALSVCPSPSRAACPLVLSWLRCVDPACLCAVYILGEGGVSVCCPLMRCLLSCLVLVF